MKILKPTDSYIDAMGHTRTGPKPRGIFRRLLSAYHMDPAGLISDIYRAAEARRYESVYEGVVLTWDAAGPLDQCALRVTGGSVTWHHATVPLVEWLIKSFQAMNPHCRDMTPEAVALEILSLLDCAEQCEIDFEEHIQTLEADERGFVEIAR